MKDNKKKLCSCVVQLLYDILQVCSNLWTPWGYINCSASSCIVTVCVVGESAGEEEDGHGEDAAIPLGLSMIFCSAMIGLWRKDNMLSAFIEKAFCFFMDFSTVLLHREMSGRARCYSRCDNEHLGEVEEKRHVLCYYDPSDHQANFLLSRLYGSSAIFLSLFLAFLHASRRNHHHSVGPTYPVPCLSCAKHSTWVSFWFNVQIN